MHGQFCFSTLPEKTVAAAKKVTSSVAAQCYFHWATIPGAVWDNRHRGTYCYGLGSFSTKRNHKGQLTFPPAHFAGPNGNFPRAFATNANMHICPPMLRTSGLKSGSQFKSTGVLRSITFVSCTFQNSNF